MDMMFNKGNPVRCKNCQAFKTSDGKCRCPKTRKFKAGLSTDPDIFHDVGIKHNYQRVRIGDAPPRERVLGFVARLSTLQAYLLIEAAEEVDPDCKFKRVNYWDARHISDVLTTADWQGKPALKSFIWLGVRYGDFRTGERLRLRCYDTESQAVAWVHGERLTTKPSDATLKSRGSSSKFNKAARKNRAYGGVRKTAAELGLKQRNEA